MDEINQNDIQDKTNEVEEQFGQDTEIVDALLKNPSDVHALLLAKRKANAEAKAYREKLEALEAEKAKTEELKLELDSLKNRTQKERIEQNLKLEALKAGVRPERLDVAIRLSEFDEAEDASSDEIARSAIAKLRESFPELFKRERPAIDVDNTGFPRTIQDTYIEAKAKGDILEMLKALRGSSQ